MALVTCRKVNGMFLFSLKMGLILIGAQVLQHRLDSHMQHHEFWAFAPYHKLRYNVPVVS